MRIWDRLMKSLSVLIRLFGLMARDAAGDEAADPTAAPADSTPADGAPGSGCPAAERPSALARRGAAARLPANRSASATDTGGAASEALKKLTRRKQL